MHPRSKKVKRLNPIWLSGTGLPPWGLAPLNMVNRPNVSARATRVAPPWRAFKRDPQFS